MEAYAIDVTSWTASFRYPNLISGFQPTLEVPPLSTVLGLINAAAGHYLEHKKLTIGYYFQYESKAVDLETIYMIDSKDKKPTNNAKSNIIKREFLFDNFLRIYVVDETIVNFFKKPVYPLVLGRMNDLATVDITGLSKTRKLSGVDDADKIRGQIVPFTTHHFPGTIQALPKYFTNTIPRQNLGTEPYSIINHHAKIRSKLKAFRDNVCGKEVDILFHEIDFTIL
ncbi:MAG TPA: type I-B CRISPR-associated protein Cas5b [Ohtaekwangia sp.]|nr:type I-B CRISPR-associated protein Cas5b [Ohtaekwangia sp.]